MNKSLIYGILALVLISGCSFNNSEKEQIVLEEESNVLNPNCDLISKQTEKALCISNSQDYYCGNPENKEEKKWCFEESFKRKGMEHSSNCIDKCKEQLGMKNLDYSDNSMEKLFDFELCVDMCDGTIYYPSASNT